MVISALGLIIPRRDCFPFSLDFSLLSEDPVNVIGNSPSASRDTMEQLEPNSHVTLAVS